MMLLMMGVITPFATAETNIDSIVMQSTDYDCGSTALATVLNNLGINATELEIGVLAGTDESGTTMYGLMQAAQAKGVNATGMKLSINKLKKNDIIFLNIGGSVHYSVINEVAVNSVKLADPIFRNIVVSKKIFARIYVELHLL
jgi:predicted double-glycine peptidase